MINKVGVKNREKKSDTTNRIPTERTRMPGNANEIPHICFFLHRAKVHEIRV